MQDRTQEELYTRLSSLNAPLEARMERLRGAGWELDLKQYKILTDAMRVLGQLPREAGCAIRHVTLKPRDLHGGVTVTANALCLEGEALHDFAECVVGCSELCLCPLVDGRLEISLTVPDVYTRIRRD